MSSDIDIYLDIEHPLLYTIYLYERLHGRYSMLKAIPPYVDRFVQKWFMRKADVIHLNSLSIKFARKAKKLGKPVVAVLHAAPFPKRDL
jgi:hypothetical protein